MFGFAISFCPIVEIPLRVISTNNRYILPNFLPSEESNFVKSTDFQLDTIICLPFEQNTFIARRRDCADCVVIDPGLEPEKIIDHLEQHGLTPTAILITHGHGDHIGGNAALKKRWPDCQVVIGADDADKLTDPQLNLSSGFGIPLTSPPADETVGDGDVYKTAGFEFQVRAIPGHSIGHVVFIWKDREPTVVFVGDVIFAGSIGRTDFPDGDHNQLISGIRSKLFILPDDTILLPGHGPETTVGEEKRNNPFAGIGVEI